MKLLSLLFFVYLLVGCVDGRRPVGRKLKGISQNDAEIQVDVPVSSFAQVNVQRSLQKDKDKDKDKDGGGGGGGGGIGGLLSGLINFFITTILPLILASLGTK